MRSRNRGGHEVHLLGYIEDRYFDGLSEQVQLEFMDACFGYDEELQKTGHFNIDSTFAERSSGLKFRSHRRITAN